MTRNPIITEDLDHILAFPLPWETFFGSSVLVSGASGFLGSYCCETLLRLNEISSPKKPATIIAFSRSLEALKKRFAAYKGRDDLVLLPGDVREGIPDFNGPVDYIIHGASPASPIKMAQDPLGVFETNVIGTKKMLELAVEKKTRRFLFLSSGAVYGDLPEDFQSVSETDFGVSDPLRLRASYDEGKRAGETLCYLYAQKYGLESLCARIGHTYGPGLSREDGRSFADFITAAAFGKRLVLHSDGSAIRYFCYITDTVNGIFTVLLKGMPRNAYNIASMTEKVSIRELAERIASIFPEKNLTVDFKSRNGNCSIGDLTSKQRGIPADTRKLRGLGWQETIKLDEGLYRAVLSYHEA